MMILQCVNGAHMRCARCSNRLEKASKIGLKPSSIAFHMSSTNRKLFRVYSNRNDREESDFLKASTKFVDSLIARQLKKIKELEEADDDVYLQLEAMKSSNAPQFLIRFIEWFISVSESTRQTERQRLKDLERERHRFVKEWKEFEASLSNEALQGESGTEDNSGAFKRSMETRNVSETVLTGDGADVKATTLIFSAFFSALSFSWISSWFGVDVGTLLPDPSLPTVGELTSWVVWTVPYAGLTAAAAAIAGAQWIGNRGTFRFLADDSFFAQLHPTGIASLAAGLGYTQAISFQGIWPLTVLNMIVNNGNNGLDSGYVYDPDVVQRSLGSLVAVPGGIWTLLAGPIAVVSAATFETAVFALSEFFNRESVEELEGDIQVIVEEGIEDIQMLTLPESLEQSSGSDTGANDASQQRQPPPAPTLTLRSLHMSTEEFQTTAVRVFLSSLWLGAETVVTGNLWWSAATGAAGLAIGMGARRMHALENHVTN